MHKKAIQFMIISAFAFALLNFLVKSINHLNVYQIVFFRSIGSLCFTIPLIRKQNINIFGNNRFLLILRGIVGCIAMTFFFLSLRYLSTGTAVSIRYISPIFGALFAAILLREKIERIQWVYFLMAFSGVLIIQKLDIRLNDLGLIFIILSAFFSGLVYILIRKLGNTEHSLVIVNYFMSISAILSGPTMFFGWTTPDPMEWVVLISLGFVGFFGQYFMTKAIQGSEVNLIAPLKYIEVIFTLIVGVILLQEQYDLLSILGMLLIVLGLTLNTMKKKLNKIH